MTLAIYIVIYCDTCIQRVPLSCSWAWRLYHIALPCQIILWRLLCSGTL